MNLIKDPRIALALGIAVIVANVGGWLDASQTLIVLGLVGFTSLVQLRDAISSSGYKTYIIAIGGAVSMGLFGFDVITAEQVTMIAGLLGIGAANSVKHGIDKAA